jgi:hypothetical protein
VATTAADLHRLPIFMRTFPTAELSTPNGTFCLYFSSALIPAFFSNAKEFAQVGFHMCAMSPHPASANGSARPPSLSGKGGKPPKGNDRNSPI